MTTKTDKPKADTRSVRFLPGRYEWLKEEAVRQERSPNWLVNKAIEQMMLAAQETLDSDGQV